MRSPIAVGVVAVALAIAPGTSAQVEPSASNPVCDQKCKTKRDRRALRRKVSRHPIPDYIVACESDSLHDVNPSSGAGGRYQIMPSTWNNYIDEVKRRVIYLAGGNKGPRWSSRLLQDIMAKKVLKHEGLGAWSCA